MSRCCIRIELVHIERRFSESKLVVEVRACDAAAKSLGGYKMSVGVKKQG